MFRDDDDNKYHIERAAEILKEVYKEHKKKLPTREEVIRTRFLNDQQSVNDISKEFDIKSEEVLAVLRENLRKRKN